MKVLLIFEYSPDETQFYSIHVLYSELQLLEKANGTFENAVDITQEQSDAISCITAAISKDATGLPNCAQQYKGIWLNSRIQPADLPNIGPFDKVFWTGIFL